VPAKFAHPVDCTGAIAGAFTIRAWGLHAIWVPAGLLAVTLILLVIDEREGTEP
jgi:uncharacterized membrane protein YoaK (UPF0700 family)